MSGVSAKEGGEGITSPQPSRGFKHVEHTADVLVEAWGSSVEEALECAALGVMEVMTDTSLVKPVEEVEVEAEGFDLESLLYDWIEQLLYIFDTKHLLLSRFKVESLSREPDGRWRFKARAWGERYDSSRHESRTLVKAMTYHMMEVVEEDGRVRVRFVVDI